MLKKTYLPFLILMSILSFTALHAQEGRGKGRLTGIVLDEEGKPLSAVELTLNSLQFDFKLTTQSDEKGKWSFYGFAGGQQPNFDLVVFKEGFIPMTLRLQLSGVSNNPSQEIVLKKADMETEVKADPKAVSEKDLALIKTAEAHQKAGEYMQAIEAYSQFLSANPIHFRYQVNLGNCQLELKNYTEAIEAFEAALKGLKAEKGESLKGNTFAADLYASIGTAWTKLENMNKAAENYKLSAEIAPPTDAALAFNLAEILMAGNDAQGAIEYYNLAIKINPKDPLYHEKLGYAHLNSGDIPQALTAFNDFLTLAPDHPRAAEVRELIKALK